MEGFLSYFSPGNYLFWLGVRGDSFNYQVACVGGGGGGGGGTGVGGGGEFLSIQEGGELHAVI